MAGIAQAVIVLVILVALMGALMVVLMVVAAIAVTSMIAQVMVIAVQSRGLVMDLLTVKTRLMVVT